MFFTFSNKHTYDFPPGNYYLDSLCPLFPVVIPLSASLKSSFLVGKLLGAERIFKPTGELELLVTPSITLDNSELPYILSQFSIQNFKTAGY